MLEMEKKNKSKKLKTKEEINQERILSTARLAKKIITTDSQGKLILGDKPGFK